MVLSKPTMSLVDAITSRRSTRGFLPDQVPQDVMQHVFEIAQQAPSNCNTQPWKVFVASGEVKDRLRDQLVARLEQGVPGQPDFPYVSRWEGEYRQRQVDCAVALYNEMGIARDDKVGRHQAIRRNFELFDAPHIVFLGMNRDFGATISLDVGIYAQTLMLAMHAFGIGSCAMGSMRAYPELVREAFGLGEDTGILLGISFGYEDPDVDANRTRTLREPLSNAVIFKG
ncbi:nitroreductase [Marinobacter sp. ANT_B65]|uniref:nitroreductase n=1 Tax=Marinobacter sp. ANT_B65 TaxID=2039467 RepID=UPI001D0D4DD9|nr:nitroreductase [Marinobacter sp. ANT_B65]